MNSSRAHKIKGYYSFIATLFAEQKHKGATFNINQSWLPLTRDEEQLRLIDKYRDVNIIPVLNERSYMQFALSLNRYARDHDWLMQSVFIRVRPKEFDTLSKHIQEIDSEIQNPYSITAIRPLIRKANTQERSVIEIQNQGERLDILEDLDQIIFHYLHKEGLYADDDIVDHSPRAKVPILLERHPFLAYAIFKHLPNLTVLYYTTIMENRRVTASMIRLNQVDCLIDERWRQADQAIDIVL